MRVKKEKVQCKVCDRVTDEHFFEGMMEERTQEFIVCLREVCGNTQTATLRLGLEEGGKVRIR